MSCDFRGAYFSAVEFSHCNFINCSLVTADFYDCHLKCVTFIDDFMRSANFIRGRMDNFNFISCDMTHSLFDGISLENGEVCDNIPNIELCNVTLNNVLFSLANENEPRLGGRPPF
jgi:uncharacterized protein YjbI with pentapeptide repeats